MNVTPPLSAYVQHAESVGIVNIKFFFLDKYNTKFVNVGLSLENDFQPCIELGSAQSSVILREEDWNDLVRNQGIISNCFYGHGILHNPIKIGNISITTEKFDDVNAILIQQDNGDGYVYLSCAAVEQLWNLIPVIEYRLESLKFQQFDRYFNKLKTNVSILSGDVLTNVYKYIAPKLNPNNENIGSVLELLTLHPELLEYKIRYQRKRYYEEINGGGGGGDGCGNISTF